MHFFTHYRSICIEWEKLCSQSEYKLCLALYGFNCLGFFCAKLCRHSKSKYIHWQGYVLMYFLDRAHCQFWGFLPRCHWIAINWRFRGQLNSKVIKRLDSIIVVQQFCNNEVEWTVKVYFDKRKNIYLDCYIQLLTISKLRTSPFLKLYVNAIGLFWRDFRFRWDRNADAFFQKKSSKQRMHCVKADSRVSLQ